MSAQEVAQAFVQHYFTQRDSNVDALSSLYQPSSCMTFEGNMVQGGPAIVQKLKGVGPVKHQVKGMDVQPSTTSSAMLIFVTGSVSIGS
ncbi:hypothetical protein TrRE_jg658, partial [Triparma retinervis]